MHVTATARNREAPLSINIRVDPAHAMLQTSGLIAGGLTEPSLGAELAPPNTSYCPASSMVALPPPIQEEVDLFVSDHRLPTSDLSASDGCVELAGVGDEHILSTTLAVLDPTASSLNNMTRYSEILNMTSCDIDFRLANKLAQGGFTSTNGAATAGIITTNSFGINLSSELRRHKEDCSTRPRNFQGDTLAALRPLVDLARHSGNSPLGHEALASRPCDSQGDTPAALRPLVNPADGPVDARSDLVSSSLARSPASTLHLRAPS